MIKHAEAVILIATWLLRPSRSDNSHMCTLAVSKFSDYFIDSRLIERVCLLLQNKAWK